MSRFRATGHAYDPHVPAIASAMPVLLCWASKPLTLPGDAGQAYATVLSHDVGNPLRAVGVNSLERLIGILDVFEEKPGVFTAEQLHARLGYTRSTMYRYLKTLTDAGLLASFHGSGFTLGPRVIELNSVMMARDPLILASRPVMVTLARQFRGTALLARRFRDKVLCIHEEVAAEVPGVASQIGASCPLTRGAGARVILANLAAPQVRRLFDEDPQCFGAAGLGADLVAVRRRLRRIRERGYEVSTGEADESMSAMAAPILDGGANVVGSLSMVVPHAHMAEARMVQMAEQVMAAAESIGHVISGAEATAKSG